MLSCNYISFGFLLCVSIDNGMAYSLQNVTALRTYLFTTNAYDKISRPKQNQTIPTTVEMDLAMYAIYDLDEVAQILKFAGFLTLQWTDETLTWNPSDFGGVQSALYPQDNVWRPDVALKNSVEDYKALGDSSLNVLVHSDGRVIWQPYQVFSSLCLVDITYFPYDEQTCEIVYVTWGYNKEDVIIEGPQFGSAVILDYLVANSEWDITNAVYITTVDPKPMMIFNITLARKPQHVMSSIILPLLILCILNVCVFVLPSSSGEKSSYAVTVFLSFVVFSTIVQSTLPANSDKTSYLSIFINFQIFQSAVITLIALFCIRLNETNSPVPNWINYLCCRLRGQCNRQNNTSILKNKGQSNEEKSEQCDRNISARQRSTLSFTKVYPFEDTVEVEDKNEKQLREITWKQMVNVIDKVLFLLLFFFNVLITIVFFVIVKPKHSVN